MKKEIRNVVLAMVVIVVGLTCFKFNVYDTQFYSVCFQTAEIHTPLQLEEVIYKSQLSSEVDGTYTFKSAEELEMWADFVLWLNNTRFIKVRSTRGASYTGEGIFLKFEGMEEELWIIVGMNGKTIKIGDYEWKTNGDIALPVDEEYLLKMKAEME